MNDAYIHDEITEQDAQAYLMGYGGLTPAEAEAKTLQWDLLKETGLTLGSSDTGLKKAVIEGEISPELAKEYMVVYDGKTEEEADGYVNQYLFTKKTGYGWKDDSGFSNGVMDAMADGKISEEEAVEWYKKAGRYTHGSEKVSREYVEVTKWRIEVPGADKINRDGLDHWNQKSGKLQAQGLGKEDFAKVWSIYSKAHAEYDANGNQTKEKAQVVMEQIGQLSGYTRTQLTALGYAVYSAKKVNAYKTW